MHFRRGGTRGITFEGVIGQEANTGHTAYQVGQLRVLNNVFTHSSVRQASSTHTYPSGEAIKNPLAKRWFVVDGNVFSDPNRGEPYQAISLESPFAATRNQIAGYEIGVLVNNVPFQQIDGNIIEGCATGIHVNATAQGRITNNVLDGNDTGLHTITSYVYFPTAVVANNTFTGNGTGYAVGDGTHGYVWNNLFLDNLTYDVHCWYYAGGRELPGMGYNAFGGVEPDFTNCPAEASCADDTNVCIATPTLDADGIHLLAGSQPVDAGTSVSGYVNPYTGVL